MVNEIPQVLALIPARGQSKSVPRKNIRPVLGKPLVAYSIECAKKCKRIQRVIVSTDDPEIAEIAKTYNAEVPFLRPAEISGDFSLDVEFHCHAIRWLQEHERYVPDAVVNLRPPHPIRNPATIDRAIALFLSRNDIDSLRSVRKSDLSPYKMWKMDEAGLLQPVASLDGVIEPYNQPRQILPMVYWQDGYVDITRPSVILEKNSTTGDRILPFLIEEECIDIDYEDEIEQAEKILKGETLPKLSPSHPQTQERYPS
ncbi:MAG: acylneuraminate cytidylyltransferase family protein [Candidatus Omnitrophota bacterium]|jgi:N-acylneuraminate cytidylyltransferase|nr:MAG: acylneuraminate cytidylyltransferase family protein [Candidatus Omnitrophota bacterium]